MTRKDFIKFCGILGIGTPIQLSLTSCEQNDVTAQPFAGKVIIVGAGAGGLSAGYLLQQQGTEFEILEASAIHGGRLKVNTDFADFPIPLGAEWIETDTNIFSEIVNNPSIQVEIETIADPPDRKFINYSWYHFFEDYILPYVADKITYNTIVRSIDHSGDRIVVTTQNGQHIADKVIVSVPLQILQDGDIEFSPELPSVKQNAINELEIWEGFKAFFEFSNKFYDDEYIFTVNPDNAGQKIFYNAAHGQNTSKHILGVFAVGKPAQDYLPLTDPDLKDHILNELDEIYDARATPNYKNHIFQNWNNEPFIRSGYLTDFADWKKVNALGEPIANKIYFAGGPYTNGEDWVSVHAAARSARQAIELINSK